MGKIALHEGLHKKIPDPLKITPEYNMCLLEMSKISLCGIHHQKSYFPTPLKLALETRKLYKKK